MLREPNGYCSNGKVKTLPVTLVDSVLKGRDRWVDAPCVDLTSIHERQQPDCRGVENARKFFAAFAVGL